MIKYIKKYFRKYALMVVVYSCLMLISWGISVFLPSIVGSFIDVLVYNDSVQAIRQRIIMFMGVSVVSIINAYFVNMFSVKLQTKMGVSMSFDITEHLKKIPFLKIIKYDAILLNQKINTDTNILVNFFLNNYLNFFLKMITLLCSFGILYFIDRTIALILICFIPIYIVLFYSLKNKLYTYNLKMKNSQNIFFAKLTGQLINVKKIKIDASFEENKKCVLDVFDTMFRDVVSLSRISYLVSGLDSVLATIANALIFLFGGLKVLKGELSIGEFTIITTYFKMMLSVISYYLNIGKSFQDSKSSFERIQELLNISEELNGEVFLENIDKIELKDITFNYGDNPILSNFNYSLKKGKIYYIKGHNGTGKSTLLNIIIGLIKEFESGSVYYNNIDMKELDIYKIRRELFSVVPQEYILEDAELEEILNNITEARELKSNLQYKGVMDDVHKLIKKINIKVSKNEKNTYSGGENQKLSIVKAILKKSEVLIMDEPTSALDIEGTEILKEILMKLKVDKIIILISHEESMEEISDMILDLDKIKNNF